jgi:hypothetical protein
MEVAILGTESAVVYCLPFRETVPPFDQIETFLRHRNPLRREGKSPLFGIRFGIRRGFGGKAVSEKNQ